MPTSHFDAHIAVGRGNRFVSSGQHRTLNLGFPNSKGRRFLKDQGHHHLSLVRTAEHGEQASRALLFHKGGYHKNIQCSGRQEFFLLPSQALEELTAGFRLLIFLTGQSFWSGIKDRGEKNDDHY